MATRTVNTITPRVYKKIAARLPIKVDGVSIFFGETVRVKLDTRRGVLSMVRRPGGFNNLKRDRSDTGKGMERYKAICKDEKLLTYAVFDYQTNCWVAETECASLQDAQIFADRFNSYNQQPPAATVTAKKMNNTHYDPFGDGGWTYAEKFNRSTMPGDTGFLLGPCPICGTVCFDYGGGWRCRALYCCNNESNPAPNGGPIPAWWNTNIQVKKDGNRWQATHEGDSATGDTPQEAVNNLKLVYS